MICSLSSFVLCVFVSLPVISSITTLVTPLPLKMESQLLALVSVLNLLSQFFVAFVSLALAPQLSVQDFDSRTMELSWFVSSLVSLTDSLVVLRAPRVY